jgi:signal transduction histidine kinase
LNDRAQSGRYPILVCAPFGRDGELLADLLRDEGHEAHTYPDLKTLAEAIGDHIGAVLLTEETLAASSDMAAALEGQPPWSDIPILLLTSRQKSGRFPVDGLVGRFLAEVTNVVLIERPLGSRSLLSATEVALRSRGRQFALRDQMGLIAQSHEVLEAKVQERTAELQEEAAQRAQAEAALRQSQKMEAVGHLTGGIAHDFNNMLTGVIGSLDIMRRRIASQRFEDIDRFMDAATASAHRAAALTQRLLAFSRRQSLDAKPTDINNLIGSVEQLIRGSISEIVDLRFTLAPDLPRAVVDVNQLESALLNLAINARDAMPKGGQLTIETNAVELDEVYVAQRPGIAVGDYVVISVSDTGVGMPPDLLEKVFDPFFTTKPVGQGTGLGLSMVYGFARQSGGQVRIYSEPGAGTSVKIFLPATTADAVIQQVVESQVPHGSGQEFFWSRTTRPSACSCGKSWRNWATAPLKRQSPMRPCRSWRRRHISI